MATLRCIASSSCKYIFARRTLASAAARLPIASEKQPQTLLASTFALRPYQEECVKSCLEALEIGGINRIGVSSPTGSGKTAIFCTLISQMLAPPERPQATRALILVGSIELARQAAAQFSKLYPGLSVQIEQGQKHRATGLADVTVATYQTLKQPERLQKYDPALYKVVIVDEAHHSVAPSYIRVLSHFNTGIRATSKTRDSDPEALSPSSSGPSVPIVGFSATFSRHDGNALGKVFQRIVYHKHFLDMMKDQWLCNVTFTLVRAQIDLSQVKINTRTGDFTPSSLAHIVNTLSVNQLVVRTWLDRAANRKSTLVFCVNIVHVKDLTAAFREAGIDARYITGSTPTGERKDLLDGFRKGLFPVLVNCAILTEGADVPNIDCVMIARPTRSRNVFAQIIGRGMRLSPLTGKTDCRVIDFVDSLSRVGGIVDGPTLFGLEPDEVVEDDSLDQPISTEDAKETEESVHSVCAPDVPVPKSVTYTDYDDPFSLAEDASGIQHISALSRNAWVQCGAGAWVLECLGRGFIKVQAKIATEGDEVVDLTGQMYHEAAFTPAATAGGGPKNRFFKPRKILKALSLGAAIAGCDTFAVKKVLFGPMAIGLRLNASWRRAPATEKQKSLLRSRFKSKSALTTRSSFLSDDATTIIPTDSPSRTLDFDSLTKGQAANILNRLNHGAMAYYSKRVKQAVTMQRKDAKDWRRREGHVVRVGPLAQAS